MTIRRCLASILAVLLAGGCATGSGGISVRGRAVTAVEAGETDNEPRPREGELIAAEPARLWILGKEQVFEVPMSSVTEVRVQRHGLTSGKALAWALLGGLVTGGALAGACSSVGGTQGCGSVFLVVGALWAGVGALTVKSIGASSSIRFPRPSAEELGPYARFPQGMPEGFDPRSLRPSPAPTR